MRYRLRVGAGVAITSGMLGNVVVTAGGLAKAGITWAGRLGMSLGRYREFVMNLPARVILDLLICFVIIALLAA